MAIADISLILTDIKQMLSQFVNQIQGLKDELDMKDEELKAAREANHKLTMERYQGLENQQTELSEKFDAMAELEANLKEKQLENEVLVLY